jgi:transcriptional regulator GlxA family with amidase domain
VDDAKALMEAMLETGLNVAGLSAHLGVSRNHLLAAFQQEAGASPIAYLRAARLRRAKELLAGTTHSLAAIAAACGYGHVKYFLRCFRDAEGITPGAWRKHKIGP